MCNIPKDHPCFSGKYKTDISSTYTFTFDIQNGRFGYIMSNDPSFNEWSITLKELERELDTYIRVSNEDCLCPSRREIPPIIKKIREMSKRHVNRRK